MVLSHLTGSQSVCFLNSRKISFTWRSTSWERNSLSVPSFYEIRRIMYCFYKTATKCFYCEPHESTAHFHPCLRLLILPSQRNLSAISEVVLFRSLLTILRTFPNFSSVRTVNGQLELSELSKFPQVRIKNTAQKCLSCTWDRHRNLYWSRVPECGVNPSSRQIRKAAKAAVPFDLQNGLRSGQQYGPGRIASLYFTSGKTAWLGRRHCLK